MTVRHIISVAVLNCGYTCPNIQKERGQYHDIFALLLRPALERLNRGPNWPNAKLNVTGWDTVNQVYPPSLDRIDAIIISGSPNGAYQDLEWIRALDRYISYVYHQHPSIKIYGSCFGHQIICQAVFRDQGALVAKDPAGWELGVNTVDVSDEFADTFSSLLPSKSLRLQFLHGDHVAFTNGRLPNGVHLVGSTAHCQIQGIYQPGKILTFQGHPEFDQFINTECLKLVGQRVGWEAEFLDSAMAAAAQSDDAAIAADIIVAFFSEPDNHML
ncbi:class I glutamine amidotransferase-like protein [Ilyonectria destructans]|nr:class I glutamine amidotransferase-like protein [Ilyonectria destructans]